MTRRRIGTESQLLLLVQCPLVSSPCTQSPPGPHAPHGEPSHPFPAPGPTAKRSDRPLVGTGADGPPAWPWPLRWSSGDATSTPPTEPAEGGRSRARTPPSSTR